jgi:hypothetical protein
MIFIHNGHHQVLFVLYDSSLAFLLYTVYLFIKKYILTVFFYCIYIFLVIQMNRSKQYNYSLGRIIVISDINTCENSHIVGYYLLVSNRKNISSRPLGLLGEAKLLYVCPFRNALFQIFIDIFVILIVRQRMNLNNSEILTTKVIASNETLNLPNEKFIKLLFSYYFSITN